MFETPEDAAADFQRRLQAKLAEGRERYDGRSLRSSLWEQFETPGLWGFIDWTQPDNAHGKKVWFQFIHKLQNSPVLLEKADGLALEFVCSDDSARQNKILTSYGDLLETHLNELATPEGESALYSFRGYYIKMWVDPTNSEFRRKMAHVLAKLCRNDGLLGTASLETLASATQGLRYLREDLKKNIPYPVANELLSAVEDALDRSKSNSQLTGKNATSYRKALEHAAEDLISASPELANQRVKAMQPIAGAVPIRGWKLESSDFPRMSSEIMTSTNETLFIPTIQQGVLALNSETMTSSKLADPPNHKPWRLEGFACNKNSMMASMGSSLYFYHFGNSGGWKEIAAPGVSGQTPITWYIQGYDEDFYVGSYLTDSTPISPLMLAGTVRDEKLNLVTSSNRRPALNPLDNKDPRSSMLSYRNKNGETVVLLGGIQDQALLTTLESGRQLSVLASMGVPQPRGEVPLYWDFSFGQVHYLVAFSPNQDQPILIFKASHKNWLPKAWQEIAPMYDLSKPEFEGEPIAAIVHDHQMWFLMRAPYKPGRSVKNDPQGFRLLRMSLDRNEIVTIPLNYALPKPILGLERDGEKPFERPLINPRSLTATSKALFFAASGYELPRMTGGPPDCGAPVPALLYITWDDINAWIAKNAPAQ
ncbi:MAG: hypothetical protein QM680_01570 [Luteolibacter sp.]